MAPAGDAHIARRIETLSPKPPRRSGKGAECEISVTGFELRLEMPGIERHRAQAELASLAREPSEKRWQEDDGADIGDEEGEGALARAWIESGCGAQAVGCREQVPQRLGHG